jgi:hypothetical protein
MKQKNQIVVLCVLVILAAAVWYEERSDSADSSSPAFVAQNYQLLSVENPAIRWDELARAQKTEYKSLGRNPFSKVAPPPAQTPGSVAPSGKVPYTPHTVTPPPPDPPVVLPANLKFFGYGTVPAGSARRAFFSDGEEIYIVAEGETLLGRFRILKVNNTNLEFEEVASGKRNTAPLVEEPVAAGGPT